MKRFPEFRWWFSTDERQYKGDDTKIDDGYHSGLAYMRDVELLARADVIVGKFTSNVERLAVEVRAGRYGVLPAFISLDAPWCFGVGLIRRGKYSGQRFSCVR